MTRAMVSTVSVSAQQYGWIVSCVFFVRAISTSRGAAGSKKFLELLTCEELKINISPLRNINSKAFARAI